METLWQDIRYGVRVLRNSPAFTIVAVLTLALGIGANTAIFTLINAVMLKMLPVRDVQRLVVIGDPADAHSRSHGTPRTEFFSYPLYRELRDRNTVFDGMLAAGEVQRVRATKQSGQKISDEILGVVVSGNYFSVLGVNALAGRTLYESDDTVRGGKPVAVISYSMWRGRFNSDPSVIGDTIRLNGYPFTIVGVTPPGFHGQIVGDVQEVWVPMTMQEQIMPGRKYLDDVHASWLTSMAQLKPGVTIDQAKANVNLIWKQLLDSDYGAKVGSDDLTAIRRETIDVTSGARGLSSLRGDFAKPLYLLMGIVGLVLLIACVNVANLLLARATVRQKEIAVRLAMGAKPIRLIRQLLTESILLALIGGVLGLLFAFWGTRVLLRTARLTVDQTGLQVQPDTRILLFTIGICVLTGILFGLVPALRSLHVELNATLKNAAPGAVGGGSRRFHWGKALVASQVALSVLVLFAAGLLVRSLHNLKNLDLGYNRERILLVRLDLPSAGYDTVQKVTNLDTELRSRMARLPGVKAVTSSELGLFYGSEGATSVAGEAYRGAENDPKNVSFFDRVSRGYFSTLGIPVIMGREITEQDTASSQLVAVVNESFVKQYFPNMNPIGRKFWWDDSENRNRQFEVVGVVKDVVDKGLKTAPRRRHYLPMTQAQDALGMLVLEIRTVGDPSGLTEAVRNEITNFNSGLRIEQIRSLDRLMDGSISNEIVIAKLSTFFGVLALVLASIGLYGVMSYTIAGRTRELGVRIALGAQRADVLKMVMREAMLLVLIGIVIGIPAAMASSRVIASMLHGLKSYDPMAMAVVILLLSVVAAIAGLIPARRATKVDPMVALRYE
jgi:predicted permease